MNEDQLYRYVRDTIETIDRAGHKLPMWMPSESAQELFDLFRNARHKIERLQAIILEQKKLWELAECDLNALDDSRHRVRFMELHDPIGKCEAAEAGGK